MMPQNHMQVGQAAQVAAFLKRAGLEGSTVRGEPITTFDDAADCVREWLGLYTNGFWFADREERE